MRVILRLSPPCVELILVIVLLRLRLRHLISLKRNEREESWGGR